MRTRIIVAAVLGLGVILATLGGGWFLLHQRQTKLCPFSGRPIHAQTRAVVMIGGQKYETCCVRCAIVEAQQTGKPLRILKVADFETGRLLDPSSAWFVESSAVNLCMRVSPAAESTGRDSVYLRGFDRCSPSALAFSSEQQARAFITQHGGALKRLADLEQETASTTGKVQKP
jgi:hypothetical protein